ncbi:MAG: amidohydrolase family protein [Dehalococcoidia bacterium]
MRPELVVDADGHILEPGTLWEEYIEPQYRDLALRIKRDKKGLEYLEIEGRKSLTLQDGILGSIGDIGLPREELETRSLDPSKRKEVHWGHNDPPAAVDPHARIEWMGERGIDVAVLYPTLGLNWGAEPRNPELAAAYCRAYNRWIEDFCQPYPDRIVPVAHLPTLDVDESIKELKRAVKAGARGTFIYAAPPNGKPYGDRYYDPLWAEAEAQEIPLGIHVSFHAGFIGSHLYPSGLFKGGWFYNLMLFGDVLLAFTSLFNGGVFERFPRLKVAVLEVGCGWVAYWLERMDSVYDFIGFTTPMKVKPSEYFHRQCWVSVEPDEELIPVIGELIGPDKLVWSSDYPHVEARPEALDDTRKVLESLPDEKSRMILGTNAVKLYNLS